MNDHEDLYRQKELLKESQALAGVGSFEWDIRTGQLGWSEQLYKIFGVDARSFNLRSRRTCKWYILKM